MLLHRAKEEIKINCLTKGYITTGWKMDTNQVQATLIYFSSGEFNNLGKRNENHDNEVNAENTVSRGNLTCFVGIRGRYGGTSILRWGQDVAHL